MTITQCRECLLTLEELFDERLENLYNTEMEYRGDKNFCDFCGITIGEKELAYSWAFMDLV